MKILHLLSRLEDEFVIVPNSHADLLLFTGYSLSFFLSLSELSPVVVSITHLDATFTVSFFLLESSLVEHPLFFNPSFTLSITILKIAPINQATLPLVDSKTIRFALLKISLERIPIGKILSSFPMLQKVEKEALKFLSCFAKMSTISFNFALIPLSHINISFWWLPNPSSMFLIVKPLTWIILTIMPKKLSNFRSLIIDKFPFISTFHSNLNSF